MTTDRLAGSIVRLHLHAGGPSAYHRRLRIAVSPEEALQLSVYLKGGGRYVDRLREVPLVIEPFPLIPPRFNDGRST